MDAERIYVRTLCALKCVGWCYFAASILAIVSVAESWMWGRTWLYVSSVITTLEWPRRSATAVTTGTSIVGRDDIIFAITVEP